MPCHLKLSAAQLTCSHYVESLARWCPHRHQTCGKPAFCARVALLAAAVPRPTVRSPVASVTSLPADRHPEVALAPLRVVASRSSYVAMRHHPVFANAFWHRPSLGFARATRCRSGRLAKVAAMCQTPPTSSPGASSTKAGPLIEAARRHRPDSELRRSLAKRSTREAPCSTCVFAHRQQTANALRCAPQRSRNARRPALAAPCRLLGHRLTLRPHLSRGGRLAFACFLPACPRSPASPLAVATSRPTSSTWPHAHARPATARAEPRSSPITSPQRHVRPPEQCSATSPLCSSSPATSPS